MKSSRTLDSHNKSNTRTETHLKTAAGMTGKARKSSSESITQRQDKAPDTGGRKKQERHH